MEYLPNEGRAGVEDDEIYLVVVVVDAGTRRFGRKSSPEVRRKPSCGELRRPICGATSGGSKNRASRATPAYIYTQGLEILESEDIY